MTFLFFKLRRSGEFSMEEFLMICLSVIGGGVIINAALVGAFNILKKVVKTIIQACRV